MTHIFSLAAGTLPEFTPAEVARAAGKSGFSHCGFTIEPEHWDAAALRMTKAMVADYGLSVLDVEVIWIPEGAKLSDDHKIIIEAGAELGAPNVLVVSSEPDKDRTAEALHQLCEWAKPANMRVSLEFLMITAVQNMPDALDIIARCDHPAAALLIDTLHYRRAGHDPSELEGIDQNLFPYTQICDGNATCADDGEAYLDDAVDLRSVPGEGALPVGEVLKNLPDNIPLSLEVRSKYYREKYPDPVERAKAVRAGTLEYLDKSGLQIS